MADRSAFRATRSHEAVWAKSPAGRAGYPYGQPRRLTRKPHSPAHPLSSAEGHNEVINLIHKHDIDLVILDSLTIGLGADASIQRDVTPIMQRLKEWGTVFAVDHISGNAARDNHGKARPFGSVFKRNIARGTTVSDGPWVAIVMNALKRLAITKFWDV